MSMASNNPYILELPSDAGLRGAQDIAATLQEALAQHGAVSITASAVTSADLTTIQLLLSAKKLADNLGKSLTLAAPPQGALRSLLVQLGFLDAFGGPLTEGSAFWTSTLSAKGKAQ